jgi:hypothetical protein
MRCIEAGVTLDGFANSIPIVALQNDDFDRLFWGFYVSYSFGSRR